MDPNRAIVFYATGIKEKEFEREAKKFQKFHKIPDELMFPVDCSKPLWRRRKILVDAFEDLVDLEYVIIFCHGWPRRIQFGYNLENVSDLADLIRNATQMRSHVVLYACSCGRKPGLNPKRRVYFPERYVGNDSFANRLALETGNYTSVWAHYNSGHTTRNPYVLLFESYGPVEWFVMPFSVEWQQWRKDMKGKLRFNFFDLEA
jgi:hypothetical protein